jgi:hypothetical protein
MSDVPMPRFIAPPVIADDEFATDDDVKAMRYETIGCPLAQWLGSLG